MSLDIYIISPEPEIKKSTGIYGRINGQTKELTPEECVQHFSDIYKSVEDVPVQIYENDEFWHGNITHNLKEMAEKCDISEDPSDPIDLFDLLWGNKQLAEDTDMEKVAEYTARLTKCLFKLKVNPEYFKEFNPSNGWGDYELLVSFVTDFIEALLSMPVKSKVDYWS